MKQPKVTRELNGVLTTIHPFVREQGHEMVTPEHILFLLLKNERVRRLLENVGVDPDPIEAELHSFFQNKLERFNDKPQPVDSLAASRILNAAVARAYSSEKKYLDVIDFLVSLMEDDRSHAHFYLRKSGLDRHALVKEISRGNYAPPEEEADPAEGEAKPKDGEKKPNKKFLEQYAVNLTELARKGEIDPIIGRKSELARIMRALHRRKKNNPLLVGESGVGKTAIVEGLARNIANDEVPEKLRNLDIWVLEMGSLVAGTKYRGEFEDRLKKVINEVRELDNAILFIDEIHTVVGAGATSSGSLDASNILKPVLNSGAVKCIGSTTYEEYKNHIIKDKAFSRRFQKIDVVEPTENESVAILTGLRPYYEKHFEVNFSLNALETAVKLSNRHINDRFLPDKAIDVIDEAGARNAIKDKKRKKTITVRDIEEIVAQMANIPPTKVSATDMSVLKTLEDQLKAEVFGQNHAIHRVTKAVKINRAGIGNKDKPSGSFLFAGPTGCGKTELSKQLAQKLGVNFLRFDMSEYAEKHTISKFIGAPPGYVGFEQSGLLTEALIKTPHCVVLMDEIEKAHPDIYNILLQIMDYGTLTDNNGRKADFRNAIIVMTSNVGARQLDANAIGFAGGDQDDRKSDVRKAVEKHFTPEFRNRLDDIIYFNPLDIDLMKRIVDKFIRDLSVELDTKKIELSVSDKAREWFATHGYDPKMGARPLERLIKSEIQEKLVDDILFGKLTNGGSVNVGLTKDKIKLDVSLP